MANSETALARVEEVEARIVHGDQKWDGLKMVVAPAEALKRVQELQAFVKEVMVPGTDFGVIPGTQKPTLYQQGAQKLSEVYGFSWRFEDLAGSIQDWNTPLFVFRKRCILTLRRDGRYVGDGIGSCNSKEDRYAWRWTFDVPAGIDKATLKKKSTRNGGTMYRLPNEDIFSLVNTVEKMACKRAFVMAVLGATRSSGIFTQDVEDLPEDAFGEAEKSRSWENEEKARADGVIVADLTKRLLDAKDPKELAVVGRAVKDAEKKIAEESRAKLRELYAERAGALKSGPKGADKPKEQPTKEQPKSEATAPKSESATQDAPPDDEDEPRGDFE